MRTERDRIECETVVDAAGIWAPRVAALAGVRVPLDAGRSPAHRPEVGARIGASAGHAVLPRHGQPRLRQVRGGRRGLRRLGTRSGRALGRRRAVGARGPIAPPRHGSLRAAPQGRGTPFPFVEDAEIVKLVCHPDAMTPDANPLVGPVPDVRGLWMAAGLSLNGFGGAGGLGNRWPSGSPLGRPSSTSPFIGRRGSGGCTRTPDGSPSSRARPIATTTSSVIPSITMSWAARSVFRRSTDVSRKPVPSFK